MDTAEPRKTDGVNNDKTRLINGMQGVAIGFAAGAIWLTVSPFINRRLTSRCHISNVRCCVMLGVPLALGGHHLLHKYKNHVGLGGTAFPVLGFHAVAQNGVAKFAAVFGSLIALALTGPDFFGTSERETDKDLFRNRKNEKA